MAIDLHNTASRLLGKLAANKASAYLQLERQTGAVQDPNTGLWTDGTKTLLPLDGALTGYADKEIDGTRIMRGDKRLVCAFDVPPLATDVVIVGGSQRFAIVNPEDVNHAGQTQVYKLQLRGC